MKKRRSQRAALAAVLGSLWSDCIGNYVFAVGAATGFSDQHGASLG